MIIKQHKDKNKMYIGNDNVKGIEYLVSINKENFEFRFGKKFTDPEWKDIYDRIGESDEISNHLSHILLDIVKEELDYGTWGEK